MLKKRMARWLGGGAVVMASVLAAVFLATPASAAVTHHVYRTCSTPGGCGLWLRTSPTPAAAHVGLMHDGDAFAVNCWQTGPATYNNPVWLQGSWSGKIGWAMDYYIDTHWKTTGDLTAQGIRPCSAGPAPVPGPTPTGGQTAAEKAAVAWAQKQVGSRLDVLMCLTFVKQAYLQSDINISNRIKGGTNVNSLPQQVWGQGFSAGRTGYPPSTPPYGALVFFNANAAGKYDINNSHVAISTGGGNLISTGDKNNPVVRTQTMAQRASGGYWNSYVGWWLPDQ